ncbi:MAG: T9SS type A sorting domain-containing protein [Ignavibacteriaceae bacterium]
MKKVYSIFITLFLLFAATTFSQTVTIEDFDYPVGDLLTAHGYTTNTGTSNYITVISGNLTYDGYPSTDTGYMIPLLNTGEDVYKSLPTPISSGTVYASFLVSVDSARTGDYFFHFIADPFASNGYRARVFVKKAANGNLAFGLSKGSTSATVPPIYTDSIYTAGDTCLIVIGYEIVDGTSNDIVKLWVNPSLNYVEPVALITIDEPTQTDINIGSYAFRQGTASSGPFLKLDGLRIGTSWSEVVKNITIPKLTIAEAIEDINNDFVPDRLGDTVTVQGVVFSPNYQTTNNSFYISDGTAGTDIFMYAPPLYTWTLGDELNITGVVTQYNGMSEIVSLDSTGWVLKSSGNTTPDPVLLTLAQYKANPEAYEGTLVGFLSLSKASGTWPASGSATLKVTDGIDTVDLRIDSDTNIDGSTEPIWPVDIIGIGSQYDASAPYDGGYQIFPRYYESDFLLAGSIPVELTSFAASVSGKSVTLNWATATEVNNSGFDIERKSASTSWQKITFVQGNGTTTQPRSYSYTDKYLNEGKYSYRLKQVDLDGTFEYSKSVEINITTTVDKFELAQNYPNPFNPVTKINFSLPEPGNVKLAVYNLLGQEVRVLVNGFTEAGTHTIDFAANNLSSGIYLYKIEANGFIKTKKMTLLK